jgi:hypothetical protein
MRHRIGIPTASRADDILTPEKLQISKSRFRYRNQILAEWLVGHPLDWGDASGWAERGRKLEDEAIRWLEFQHDVEVQRVGFLLRDDGMFGGSPDGIIGNDGGVEIKVPAMHTHIGYMIDNATLAAAYRGQVQAYLNITGREWWKLVSYHPDLPPVVLHIEREDAYARALDAAINVFSGELLHGKDLLAQYKRRTLAEERVA